MTKRSSEPIPYSSPWIPASTATARLGSAEPQLDFLKPGVDSGADPVAIGERVLRGVRDNETWIFTHPEMRPLLEARFRTVLDAFDGQAFDG